MSSRICRRRHPKPEVFDYCHTRLTIVYPFGLFRSGSVTWGGTSMIRTLPRTVALLLLISLGVASCSDSGTSGGGATGGGAGANESVDYKAIGLWNDGPCDKARPPLIVGIMTVYESPVLSLGDQFRALQAAAEGFNQRGGANGACIQDVGCREKSHLGPSLPCVR